MIVGWILLWRDFILVLLNVVDASEYLTVGLMILLFVIVMSCWLIFIHTILLAKSFVFVIIIWYEADCLPSSWNFLPIYVTG